MFKSIRPELDSYTQSNLVSAILGPDFVYDVHNALGDVSSLKRLVEEVGVDEEVKMKSTFTNHYILESLNYSNEVKVNLPSLEHLVQRQVISNMMARKIAGSGLRCNHLITVFRRSGEDGIRDLFAESSNGRPRVTRSTKVVQDICKFIQEE